MSAINIITIREKHMRKECVAPKRTGHRRLHCKDLNTDPMVRINGSVAKFRILNVREGFGLSQVMKLIAHQQFILSLVQEIRIEDKFSKRLTNGANFQSFICL